MAFDFCEREELFPWFAVIFGSFAEYSYLCAFKAGYSHEYEKENHLFLSTFRDCTCCNGSKRECEGIYASFRGRIVGDKGYMFTAEKRDCGFVFKKECGGSERIGMETS